MAHVPKLVVLAVALLVVCSAAPVQAQLPQTVVGSNCSACNPVAADTADVNQDGAMDVLVVSQDDSTVAWYENDGSGSFTERVITTGVPTLHTVQAADFDGDDDVDVLAVGNQDREIKWYDNDGGAWTKRMAGDGGFGPEAVRAVDLDQNGTVDIVSVQSTESGENGLVWYSNQGGGSFSNQKVITTGIGQKEALRVADLDGQNGLDVIATDNVDGVNQEKIVWFPNQGDDTFGAAQVIEQEDEFDYLATADVDQDGATDVLAGVRAADLTDGGVEWYESDGTPSDGGWTTHLVSDSIDSDIYALHVDDVDDNGYADVLAGSRRDQVHLYENDGTPTSGEEWSVQTITQNDGAHAVGAADFDGDTQTDVFYAARKDDRVAWVKNDGMGTFPLGSNQFSVTTLENRSFSFHAADVDGDNENEIIEGGAYILWYDENGMGDYVPNVVSFRSQDDEIEVVDIDGDGDKDILGYPEFDEDNILWYENDGQGNFAPGKRVTDSPQGNIQSYTTAFVDNDDLPDVVYASIPFGSDTPPGRVVVRVNDGDGTFTTKVLEEEGRFNGGLKTMDVDGDGDTDVLQQSRTGGPNSRGEIEWYENLGDGDFPTPSGGVDEGTTIAPYSGIKINTADVDSDGDKDLLVSSVGDPPRALEWYENEDNASTFRRDTIDTPPPAPREDFSSGNTTVSGTGDLDQDGATDIVAVGNGLIWRRNQGSGNFSTHRVGPRVEGLTLDDVDGDNDLDILAKENSPRDRESRLLWFENRNLDLPQPPTSLSGQTLPAQNVARGVEEIELSWSASPSSDVEQYFIYRERVPFGSPRGLDAERGPYYYQYALLDSVSAGQTSYVDTDRVLQADSTYHYRVAAGAPYNLKSSLTAEVTATPSEPLAAHSLQPRSGGPGTLLRIKGSGFSPKASDHTVTVDDVQAPVDSAKTNVVYARIPSASALPDTARGAVDVTLQTDGQSRTVAEDFQLVRKGSESFTAIGSNVTPVTSRYLSVDWADYDDDGDADLVVVGENANRESSATLYRNDNGSFTPVDQGLTDIDNGAEWGDYDGDGTIELMLVGGENTITLYQNDGSGTLTESLVSSGRKTDGTGIRNDGVDAAFHDYDTDGNLDLFVTRASGDEGKLYRNDEKAVFSWGEPLPDAGLVRVKDLIGFLEPDGVNTATPTGESVDWGDYNGDGLVDLLTDNGEIYRNRGDGTFQEVDTRPNDPNVRLGAVGAAEWGDFDQDGDLDIAVAGSEGFANPAAKIYENKGNGTFEPIGAGLTGVRDAPAVEWGDFTGNGRPDLAIAGRAEDNPDGSLNYETKIYRNDGGGSFTALDAGLTGMARVSLTAIDVDNDGDLDLLATGRTRPDFERERRLYRNEPPSTAQTTTVSGDGTQDFGDTGTDLSFSGVSGSGDVTVERFDGPQNPDGIDESNVSESLVSIDTTSGLTFSSARVELAVSEFLGINDPTEVTIYKRPEGGGEFTALTTDVGTNGTSEVSDDTLYATVSSFSDFVLASNTQGLPVEFAGFEAEFDDEAVQLSWATASEQNNAGFRVQRRYGETEWTTLGQVEGSGTTTQEQRYRFTDGDLPYEADSLTYRLKQIDTDGSTAFSDPITVERGVDEVKLMGTYPNPVRQRATVRYALPERQEVTVRLYDVLGRRVRTIVRAEQEGRHERQLDVSGLSSSVYFLRLRAGGQTRTQKLTVVQ